MNNIMIHIYWALPELVLFIGAISSCQADRVDVGMILLGLQMVAMSIRINASHD